MTLLIEAAIGFVAGLLGGLLGVGGSVIIIPGLLLYLSLAGQYVGNTQHLLQAAAMITNVFIAAPASLAHFQAKAVMKSVVVWLVPAALVGILLGVTLSNSSLFARQNGVYLAMVLAGFLLFVAAYNTVRVFGKTHPVADSHADRKIPAWKIVLVGVPMGFAAGLLGIGGGAVCVPAQQIVLKVPLRRAIANSAMTIMCVAAVGALYKNLTLPSHDVDITASLKLAAMLIPTAILGGYLGGKLTHALPRTALRVVFIVFMVTIAYLTFTKAWASAGPKVRSDPIYRVRPAGNANRPHECGHYKLFEQQTSRASSGRYFQVSGPRGRLRKRP